MMIDYSHIINFSEVFIKLKQVLRKLIKLRKFYEQKYKPLLYSYLHT